MRPWSMFWAEWLWSNAGGNDTFYNKKTDDKMILNNETDTYWCRTVELLLLPLKHNVVHFVPFELFLTAVQQQLPEVNSSARFVCHWHLQLQGT